MIQTYHINIQTIFEEKILLFIIILLSYSKIYVTSYMTLEVESL